MLPAVYLFFNGEIKSYCRWRDLQWPWMLRRQQVWGHLPYRAFIIYPDLGVDLSKLLLVKSTKTRIAWHLIPWTIQFDFLVGCLYGNLVPSLLSFQTSPAAVALTIYQTVIKPCVISCSCIVIRCLSCCCFYFSVVVVLFFFFFFFFCCYTHRRVFYYDVCHLCPLLCRVILGFIV